MIKKTTQAFKLRLLADHISYYTALKSILQKGFTGIHQILIPVLIENYNPYICKKVKLS